MASLEPLLFFGEAGRALAIAVLIAIVLVCAGHWMHACRWLASFCAGAALIFACKLAFEIGGWYSQSLGIYSVSGHAMLTTAVYPVLLMLLGSAVGPRAARIGLVTGFALALLVACALVAGRYHTLPETLLGAAIGLGIALMNARGLAAGRAAVVTALAIVCVISVSLDPRAVVRPIRGAVAGLPAKWFDNEQRYYRLITADPVTGRSHVKVLVHYRDSMGTERMHRAPAVIDGGRS